MGISDVSVEFYFLLIFICRRDYFGTACMDFLPDSWLGGLSLYLDKQFLAMNLNNMRLRVARWKSTRHRAWYLEKT